MKKWLGEEYPAIKERAARENGVIYFSDETGMRSDHQAGRSYAPKGKTPVTGKTGKRFSLNMVSAISNRGHLEFMVLDGRFNSEVFKAFLEQMIKNKREKIFLIVDGHPSHKTIKLREWPETVKDRIEVFFLPPCRPELNPQEYLNQDVKTDIIGKKRAINKERMRGNVEGFMMKRKSDKRQVRKYFRESRVLYAA